MTAAESSMVYQKRHTEEGKVNRKLSFYPPVEGGLEKYYRSYSDRAPISLSYHHNIIPFMKSTHASSPQVGLPQNVAFSLCTFTQHHATVVLRVFIVSSHVFDNLDGDERES